MRKGKSARTLWTLLLVGVFLFGLFGSGSLAAPEGPQWKTLDATAVDPGPGWPQGWIPPAAPTEISSERRETYESFNSEKPPEERTDQLVLRVQPMPDWTKEYPYYWKSKFTSCANTTYLYYYPYPDMELAGQLTSERYVPTEGGGGICGYYYQVLSIRKPLKYTQEEIEHERLVAKLQEDTRLARKGLDWCPEGSANTTESILVCFNGGEASEIFDVPAYLDTDVSRVRVPVRFVSELMGATVTWDEVARQVTISFPETIQSMVKVTPRPGHTPAEWYDPGTDHVISETYILVETTITQPARHIVLTIGNNTAYVDGQPITIDAPPVIRGDRTMVPIRFVSEQLGAKVYWVGRDPIFPAYGTLLGTYQVHIYTAFHPWYDNPSWFLENRAVKW